MSLRSANIALGRLERGVPAEHRPTLWYRAVEAIDKADARLPIEDADAQRKLEAAQRRYRRLRVELEGARLPSAVYQPPRPRQARLP